MARSDSGLDDRAGFTERLRRQLQSRYREMEVTAEPGRFALRLQGPGIDTTVPLTPLQHRCQADPDNTAVHIADFVRGVERQLVPRAVDAQLASRLIWCVRTRGYLEGLGRSDELIIDSVAGDLLAFVAESLPGQIMQGLPRERWLAADQTEESIRAAAQRNLEQRFDATLQRVRQIERIPADGWRLAADSLYQGSVLLLGDFLRALVEAAESEVLIAHPDRGLVLAIAVNAAGAGRFPRRVLREFREALNPVSRDVLVTDGSNLEMLTRAERRRPQLLGWLRD